MVEIDGLYGTIEQVGARSTRVKTGSNLEIIVPNSRFLEKIVDTKAKRREHCEKDPGHVALLDLNLETPGDQVKERGLAHIWASDNGNF